MHHYPWWKNAIVLTAASYLSPPFSVWSSGPCGGLLLLIAKPHGFPTFHHSPSLVGSCANSIQWHSSETSELVGFGANAWISSLFWLPPTPPHSSLKVFTSVLVHTESSLYSSDMVAAVIDPSRDVTPAPLSTKASEAWLLRHKAWPYDVIRKHVHMYNPGKRVLVCHHAA